MRTDVGIRGCDTEIGRPGRGWHSCKKPIVVISCRHIGDYYYELGFCKRHAEHANKQDGNVVIIDQIKEWQINIYKREED